ncbi:MAG: phosphoribosyl-AMP cyclohydrolase [Oleiphilus sp.]|nr:MAG: phosphoribosyl-AMP cyclohydrolase [Oleiphilus sp.]
MKEWFKNIENAPEGSAFPLARLLEELNFNDQGLIPVIAQDADSLAVLMFAWMNHDALLETLNTGRMCYWSRSRRSLWRKGESSGHTQKLHTLSTDCDGDVLLAKVSQRGAACHTHRRSCFYLKIGDEQVTISGAFIEE